MVVFCVLLAHGAGRGRFGKVEGYLRRCREGQSSIIMALEHLGIRNALRVSWPGNLVGGLPPTLHVFVLFSGWVDRLELRLRQFDRRCILELEFARFSGPGVPESDRYAESKSGA